MKRPFNKDKVEKACPVGSMIAETLEEDIKNLSKLLTKFKAVINATGTDVGKSLLIDNNGNVKLST